MLHRSMRRRPRSHNNVGRAAQEPLMVIDPTWETREALLPLVARAAGSQLMGLLRRTARNARNQRYAPRPRAVQRRRSPNEPTGESDRNSSWLRLERSRREGDSLEPEIRMDRGPLACKPGIDAIENARPDRSR
jgi:hypothetical protein